VTENDESQRKDDGGDCPGCSCCTSNLCIEASEFEITLGPYTGKVGIPCEFYAQKLASSARNCPCTSRYALPRIRAGR
jgi:hypothetical protein